MPARSNFIAVALLIVMASAPVRAQQTDDSGCIAPSLPDLPTGLIDDVDVERVSGVVDAAMTANMEYLSCIDGALEHGKDDMTAKERQKLESAIEKRLSKLSAMADKWNGMYTRYIKRKLKE